MGGGRTWRLDCKTRVDLTGVTREKLVMQTGRVSDALTNATRTFENYICVASFCKKTVLLQVQRKEIESHLQEAVRPHVDLAFAKLTSTQEELKRSQDLTSKLNEKFNALERKFEEQQGSLYSLLSNDHREKVSALEKEVRTFKKKAIELQNRVETLEMIVKDDSKKGDSMEKNLHLLQIPSNQMRKIEQKERRCMSKAFAILPREEICSDIDPCFWTKEWKIQGFRGFLKRADRLCFVTLRSDL